MSKSRRNTNTRVKPQVKDGKIHIVNLESYSRPDIKEYSNQDWVSYGDDNNYFEYMIDRYNGSQTNHAAIHGNAEHVYGNVIEANEGYTE